MSAFSLFEIDCSSKNREKQRDIKGKRKMKYLKKWYINLSIQRKILYCTLGVALVVLLAASVSQYMSASSIVTEQTRKQSAGVVNELSVNLDHYFDMVRNSFEYIANNSTV